MKRRGKWEILEKTRSPIESSGTIPTCEYPVTRPGIESGDLPWRSWSVRRRSAVRQALGSNSSWLRAGRTNIALDPSSNDPSSEPESSLIFVPILDALRRRTCGELAKALPHDDMLAVLSAPRDTRSRVAVRPAHQARVLALLRRHVRARVLVHDVRRHYAHTHTSSTLSVYRHPTIGYSRQRDRSTSSLIYVSRHLQVGRAALDFEVARASEGESEMDKETGYYGNTARLARRSDEALGVRVSVARIAPSFLNLRSGIPTGAPSNSSTSRRPVRQNIYRAGSPPEFRIRETWQMVLLAVGFSRDSSVYPPPLNTALVLRLWTISISPDLLLHDVGVDLAHVAAAVRLLHLADVQPPRVVQVVRDCDARVVRDHLAVEREDRLVLRSQPSHLPTHQQPCSNAHFLSRQPTNYQKKRKRKFCTPDMLAIDEQILAEEDVKRKIAADFGISEATLRKRLKKGLTLNDLRRLAFEYAEANNIVHRVGKVKVKWRHNEDRIPSKHNLSAKCRQIVGPIPVLSATVVSIPGDGHLTTS
ncbi:hypothetical protein PR048_015541 [Dryococelus australis]|uniref:HTH psq-type domain-containing protein n=1 Tax=Dryococelus australis TaxID=614101 RepID=A0ABQ9HHG7_9NEOP|nr:hypothetical protein PR048_015541 [Dryococelus australis]